MKSVKTGKNNDDKNMTDISLKSRFVLLLQEDPKDLSFWLEDLYTPGYDSLLKRKEAEQRRNKMCKMAALVIVSVLAVIIIITVPVVVTKK